MSNFSSVARKRSIRLVLAVQLAGFLLAGSARGQIYDETIYVGPPPSGPVSGPVGSRSNPYASIDSAVQYAVYVNKRNLRNTQILVAPGTYRESINLVTYTNIETNQPDNPSLITIEAEFPGELPIVSGSDVWTGWAQSGEIYTHHWPYDWGVTEARFSNLVVDDIVLRREMVFVNGDRLTPVDTLSALVAGTFFVSEAVDSVYVFPNDEIDLNSSLVEVAVRPTTWSQEFENNVTIRGLVFQHANDEWLDGSASFRISSSHGLTIEDCIFRDNNWTGLYIGRSDSVTVSGSKMNNNGGRGLAVWNLRHARFEYSETNGNNWRGFLGNFTGWTVGNNVDSSHDVTFIRHIAEDNYARGLWFDTDIEDILIEASTFHRNRNDGLFIEASQGPITVRNSYLVGNGRDGLFTGAAENLTLENNHFKNNVRSAVRVSGTIGGREIKNFETDSVQIVETRWWTMHGNRFAGSGPFLFGTTVDDTTWTEFIGTLSSDNNDWCHPAQGAIFQVPGGELLTLANWRASTGQDLQSTYCNPALDTENDDDPADDLSVEVYPNPMAFSGRIEITSPSIVAHETRVYDTLGRLVLSTSSSQSRRTEIRIDASKLAPGIYFAVSRVGSKSIRTRFAVVR